MIEKVKCKTCGGRGWLLYKTEDEIQDTDCDMCGGLGYRERDGAEIRPCILCDKMTTGSVGAAGYVWPMICQECKDTEDEAIAGRLRGMGDIYSEGGSNEDL